MTTILGQAALPAQSQVASFDKMLRFRSRLKDIYVNLDGLYKRTEREIPNAIYMKVDEGTQGTNNITITMKLPLTGAVVRGNNRLGGTEEQPNTKAVTLYRNNYKKAVSTEEYGVRHLDQIDYGLYKQHVKDLSPWAQQNHGLDIRMAFLRRYSFNLLAGDTVNVCIPEWNPHFYVQGASDVQQPAYNSNDALYTNNIVNAILNAGGGSLAPTIGQAISFRALNKIAEKALDEKLYTLDIEGSDAYILVLSPLQAQILTDPTWVNATGGLTSGGGVWMQTSALPDKVQQWYNIIGCFRSSIGVNIYCVVDPKCPTLLPSGTAEPFSLADNYVWPGDVDLRNKNAINMRDACYLLARAALVAWEPEKLHFVKQDDDYYRIMGHGVAGVRGIQLPIYDQQNPNATSREYYGGMVCVFARPAYN